MTTQERDWLLKIKGNPNYKIVVDNDSIWIDGLIEDDMVFEFQSYGQDFIVDMMNELGYYTEHC